MVWNIYVSKRTYQGNENWAYIRVVTNADKCLSDGYEVYGLPKKIWSE